MTNEGNSQAVQREQSILAGQRQAALQYAIFNAKQVSGAGMSPQDYNTARANAYARGLAESGATPFSDPSHIAGAQALGIDLKGYTGDTGPPPSAGRNIAVGVSENISLGEEKAQDQQRTTSESLGISDKVQAKVTRGQDKGVSSYIGGFQPTKGPSQQPLPRPLLLSTDNIPDKPTLKGKVSGYADYFGATPSKNQSKSVLPSDVPVEGIGSFFIPAASATSGNNISTDKGLVTIYTNLGSKGQVIVPSAPQQQEYVYPPLTKFSGSMIDSAKKYGANSVFILDENGKQIDNIPLKSADRVLPLALQSYSSLGTKVQVGFTPNPDNLTSKDTGKVKLPPDSTFTQAKDVAKGIGVYLWSIPESIAHDIQTGKIEGGRLNIFTGQYEGGISGPEVSPSASPAYKAGVEIGSVLPYIFAFGPSKGSPKPISSSSYFSDLFNPVKSAGGKGSADIGLTLGEKTKQQQYSSDFFNLFNRDLAGEPAPIKPPKSPSGGGGPKFTSTVINLGRGIGQLVPFGPNGAIFSPPTKPTPPNNKPTEGKPTTKEIKSGGSSLLLQEQEQKSTFKEYPILLGEGEGQLLKTEQQTKQEPKVQQEMQKYLQSLKPKTKQQQLLYDWFGYAYLPTPKNQASSSIFSLIESTPKLSEKQPSLFGPILQPKTKQQQPPFTKPKQTPAYVPPRIPKVKPIFDWPIPVPTKQKTTPTFVPPNIPTSLIPPPEIPPQQPPPPPIQPPKIKIPEEEPFFPFIPFGGSGNQSKKKRENKSYILYGTNPFAVGEFYTPGLAEQTVSASPSIFLAGEKIIRKANKGRIESGYFSINTNPPKKGKKGKNKQPKSTSFFF